MSWSETLQNLPYEDLDSLEPKNEYTKAALDQFEEAKEAAVQLVSSGCFGDPKRFYFNITLGGHSNPDHEPLAGWANDCVSIYISQAGVRSEVLAGS